jgi:Poly(R)-hydroxyalkanoic acid synthase subunit (PHA_synth_III_E)
MAQAPNPMQGFNDWLAYQQSMMEKMAAVMTEATPKNLPGSLHEMGLQNQAKALTDAWATQTQRANDAIAQMSKAWADATGGASAMGQSAPAWPAAMPAMPNLMDPALQEKLKAMLGKFGVGLPGGGAGGMPSVADAMLERLTKAPAFAHLWDLDKKLVSLMASWTRLHTANLAYRTLVAKAWTGLQQAAIQKAAQNALTAKAPPTLDWSEGADAWLAELNTALTDLMRTPDYATSQKELLAAGTEVRDQLKKLGDEMAPWFQLPSGDEVGDMAKSVAEMRKQLRRMAPASAGGSAGAAEPKAGAKRSPRR